MWSSLLKQMHTVWRDPICDSLTTLLLPPPKYPRVIFDLYGGWESRFLTFSKLHRGCLEGIHCIQPMLSIAHRWGVCDLLGQRLQLSYSSTGWYVPQALNRSNPFIISVLKQIEWCHHDPLHEIHAHRKLLDLEGWKINFFADWSGISQSVSHNSIFFFICDFWRDIGKLLWKFGIFSDRTRKTISKQSTAMNEQQEKMMSLKWRVVRSSKGNRSAVSCSNKMQK